MLNFKHYMLVLIHPCICMWCRRGWGSSLLELIRPVNLKIPCSFIVFLCLLWETISLRAETCLLSSSRSDCSWTVAMLVTTLYFRPSKVIFFVRISDLKRRFNFLRGWFIFLTVPCSIRYTSWSTLNSIPIEGRKSSVIRQQSYFIVHLRCTVKWPYCLRADFFLLLTRNVIQRTSCNISCTAC